MLNIINIYTICLIPIFSICSLNSRATMAIWWFSGFGLFILRYNAILNRGNKGVNKRANKSTKRENIQNVITIFKCTEWRIYLWCSDWNYICLRGFLEIVYKYSRNFLRCKIKYSIFVFIFDNIIKEWYQCHIIPCQQNASWTSEIPAMFIFHDTTYHLSNKA